MSDYMPKCATCEHFESCIIQKHITEMALILWNISREKEKERTAEQTEPQTDCETCKHNKLAWYSEVCDGCSKAHSNYEPKTEPQTERSACDTCQWYNSGIPCGIEPSVCKREVTDIPQTDCPWK